MGALDGARNMDMQDSPHRPNLTITTEHKPLHDYRLVLCRATNLTCLPSLASTAEPATISHQGTDAETRPPYTYTQACVTEG